MIFTHLYAQIEFDPGVLFVQSHQVPLLETRYLPLQMQFSEESKNKLQVHNSQ